ncbi:MAG: endonuclease domain-containing protein [Ruminococcaceae bacterium]|nr:endonuclease domain-containing protein [Oscillospiraceae bacterium]
MDRKHNRDNVPFARELRKNMTKEERHLWYDFLRTYPVKFTRQKIIGKYILDFYCAEARLAIELDGSQHFQDAKMLKDKERTNYLSEYEIHIIRIPNNEINKNFRGVCEYIDEAVRQSLRPR